MNVRVVALLGAATAWLRSFAAPQTIDRARGDGAPVRVVVHRGRKRLDGATVNHSFGTLHTILGEALQLAGIAARPVRSVLALGLGAGSLVHLLRRDHRIDAPIVGVEVDGEVLRLARAHFRLDAWLALDVVHADATAFVAANRRTFDLVVVDLFVDAVVPPECRGAPF